MADQATQKHTTLLSWFFVLAIIVLYLIAILLGSSFSPPSLSPVICIILLALAWTGRVKMDFNSLLVVLVAILLTAIILFVFNVIAITGGLPTHNNPIASYSQTSNGGSTLSGGLLYLISPVFPSLYTITEMTSTGSTTGFPAWMNYEATANSQLYLSATPTLVPEWLHLIIASVALVLLVLLFETLLKKKVDKTAKANNWKPNYLYAAVFTGVFAFALGAFGGIIVYIVCASARRFLVR